jgi:hypothetical protein
VIGKLTRMTRSKARPGQKSMKVVVAQNNLSLTGFHRLDSLTAASSVTRPPCGFRLQSDPKFLWITLQYKPLYDVAPHRLLSFSDFSLIPMIDSKNPMQAKAARGDRSRFPTMGTMDLKLQAQKWGQMETGLAPRELGFGVSSRSRSNLFGSHARAH